MHHKPELYTRWLLDMLREEFFRAGQRVGVAVSGGPDSVLLLHFMSALARERGLKLAAVHFNHHLRGAESDGDEALVRKLAASLGIDYLGAEAEVGRVARERRRNLEAVARELRYQFFFALVSNGRLDCVATAHTANDQAETVLMRLLRGTGTRGLGGIFPRLGGEGSHPFQGRVVRPFLGVTRAEVVQEIAARELPYRVDSSNLDTRLRRNKVRLELLPLLARDYNPEIIPLLNQFADRARDEEACLESLARERAEPSRVRDGDEERIPVRALQELPPALARRVLRQMLEGVRGSLHGLGHVHIESLRRFASEAQSGKIQTLPGGTVARKEFSWLVLGRATRVSDGPDRAKGKGGREFSYPVAFPGDLAVPEIGLTFRFKILNRYDPGKAYNLRELGGLDPQKLCGELVLRSWQAGDSLCPEGSQAARKLKELFRERKIPVASRQGWPVLLCAGQIVWTRGFPPAKNAAATSYTQQVLIVEEEPA